MISPDILQLGMVTSLRSGVWYQDALLLLLLPFLIHAATGCKGELQRLWRWHRRAQRQIVYEHNGYGNCYDKHQNRNHLLIRAVLLYINRHRMSLHHAEVCLVALTDVRRNSGYDDNDEGSSRKKKVAKDQHRLICMPPTHLNVPLKNGMTIMLEKTFVDNSKTTRHRHSLDLQGDSERELDGFIHEAYTWYQDELQRENDGMRYMYFPKYEEKHWQCQRYTLSDCKTFSSLFFPQKEQFMQLLGQFEQRSGKFAIEGYPHKLGILLHGPPGTGKTSLIKAVAHHTNRHIVHIPLSRVETNQQLREFMYDIGGANMSEAEDLANLNFGNVVFCMEEVDLISKITQRRCGDATPEAPAGVAEVAQLMSLASPAKALAPPKDALNLDGLLEVLDGIVDCPGRIVIMTTNHPEKLDPALVRPGRIHLNLRMGPLGPPDMRRMVDHYFGEGSGQKESYPDDIVAAKLENLCGSCETVEELWAALTRGAA
jgi:mitochondrial chaperone BCS1